MCDVCKIRARVLIPTKDKLICNTCVYKNYCILCMRHVNECGIRDHYICKSCSKLEDEDPPDS